MRRILSVGLAALGGCTLGHIKYKPDGVEQRIGASAEVLATAELVWACEGGERFVLVDEGMLFVASQDYFISEKEELSDGTLFSYARSTDGINDVRGVHARFFVPADRSRNLIAIYAANYVTDYDLKTHTYTSGDTMVTVSAERTTRELLPVRSDSCWREGGSAQDIYRGALLHDGGPPAGARRFTLRSCAVNGPRSGLGDRADLTADEIQQSGAFEVWGNAEDSALVPQEAWIDDAGRVWLLRADGTGLELTYPTQYGGVSGHEYSRAGVPVFVTLDGERSAAYVFRFDPSAAAEPVKLDGTTYAVACGFSEAT